MAARVSGVHVWCDFLSPDEERELIVAIDRDEWRPSQSGRRKQDYGPKVNFRKRRVRAAGFSGLPPLSRALALRVRAASPALLGDFVPVEQCHLEYEPSRGSSIDAHLDDAWLWGDRLVTVNLLSDTALTLTRPAAGAGGDVGTRGGVAAGEAADGSVSLPPQGGGEAAGGMRAAAGDGEGARRETERPGGVGERRDGPRHSGDVGTLTTGVGGGRGLGGGVEETGDGAGDVHSPGGAGEVDVGDDDDDDDDDGEYVTLRPLSFWRQRRENRLRQNPSPDLQSPTATTPQMHRPPAPRNSGSWVRVLVSSVTVRVPSPRRSLVLLRGAARRSWLHAVRRGDVTSRRVCITLRELSAEFRPEPRALALLADEALGPEGTARTGRAEPEEAAAATEVGELQSGRSAEIGAQLLATALTFRGIPVL
ncbi:alpha-ketoglutarate-dependent dioxygenase alkB homolog 4 isoform X2 [Petromyzon marinus]|nr:alpha-ketoglutarate-dependent dioxygenase alkB homolog 4 isoform X2 [Petromyzon marinus]